MIHLDNTLGAAYIGNIAAAILYGAVSIQTLIFFKLSTRDSVYLRVLVLVLWSLAGLHLCLVSHTIYHYSVSDRSILGILVPTWSIKAHIFVTCLADLIVRSMFAMRVWRLSRKNKLLTIIIAFFSLFVFVTGAVFGSRTIKMTSYATTKSISWLFYTSLAAAVIADCVIASCLCVLFHRGRTGHAKTDSLLTVLMLYSINTGLITSLAAITCFITYALLPNDFYYMAIFFVLTGLNVNCLLASLNARTPLRERILSLNTLERPQQSLLIPQNKDEGDDAAFMQNPIRVKADTVFTGNLHMLDSPKSPEPAAPNDKKHAIEPILKLCIAKARYICTSPHESAHGSGHFDNA